MSSWDNLARCTVLIKFVQSSSGIFTLQIWITLQVCYFKMDVEGQIRGIYGEWPAENFDGRKTWTCWSNPGNRAVILSLTRFTSAVCWVEPHLSHEESGLHQQLRVASSTMNTFAVIKLQNNFTAPKSDKRSEFPVCNCVSCQAYVAKSLASFRPRDLRSLRYARFHKFSLVI